MKNKLLILPLLLIFLVFGCKNSLIQTDDIVTVEYGSLSIGDTTESRALKIDKILGAKVSVSGYEFNDNDLSRETSITDGRVSGVKIERIPVGKNRIVTVQAASKSSEITESDFMNGVVMRAVTDINPGANSVSVNWASTALGNVFYELLNLDYDISTITTEEKASIAEAIPTDVHATLVNAKKIAEDFKSGTLQDKSAYALSGATVKFDVNGTNYDDYIVQVTDPASKKEIKVEERKVSGITAGTWDLVVWSKNGFEWYRESKIDVAEGDVIELGKLNFITPEPRFSPSNTYFVNSIEISIEAEPGSTIYYTTDGSDPTVKSTEYIAPFSITADTTIKAFATIDNLVPSAIVTKEYKISNLGANYPTSGDFLPVDLNGETEGFGWSTQTWKLGATVNENTVEFAVYSKNATEILLEIYDEAYGADAKYDYWMEKGSDDIWRAKIEGAGHGTLYAFRAWGPNWEYNENWQRGNSDKGFGQDYDSNGNRFNPNKVLFDPYAKEISHDKSNPTALGSENGGIYGTGGEDYNGVIRRNFDTGKYAPKSVVVDDSTSYGTKPKIPQEKAIIYEAHVRGITKHASSANLETILKDMAGFEAVKNIPTEYQGTYKGAAMLAPYLKALGVNTIELLPVHESDNDANPDNAPGGNYWAYMTYGYFAPDRRYSSDKSYGGPTKEFKEMVAAFHEAGMEVYLDVVFNHSGEGGPWYGTKDSYNTAELTFMRGLDCSEYYCLTPGNVGDHWQTTGCGNNLRCDNPIVRKLILDSLEYWIAEMGVDGYRFDLAPVIGREFKNNTSGWLYNKNATTIKNIMSLGTQYDAEMIAEAWDCHGSDGYHVGNFPTGWGEWNGRFRDSLRGFVNAGNRGSVNDYINGDYNNFNDQGGPHKTVNFVVAHDGFTLADLCSYGGAGNTQNGELTWPFGPSDGGNGDNNSLGFVDWTSEATQKASKRQANRNYTAIQMMSRGVPMIVWGDEFTRTQNGNNNPYNIDSVATWSNYNMINTVSPHAVATGGSGTYHDNFGIFANNDGVNGNFMFMNYMLKLKASEPALNQDNYNVGYNFKKEDGKSTLVDGDRCVWLHIDGSSVSGGSDYLIFMNMYTSEVSYTIPTAATGKKWVRLVDTQSYFETDFNCWDEKSATTVSSSYGVTPWSVVILKEVENVVVPTVATPSISGSSYFDSSTTVTITCGTNGATIYYTTDGTIPSVTKGTEYTAPFTISSTTTVKAKAFKTNYQDSSVASKTFTKGVAPVGSSKSGVMLQGFNWSSAKRGAGYNKENPSPHWYKWYDVVANRGSDIGDKFEYLWCPPPSATDTSSSEGYGPTELNNLNNCYGTEEDLTAMIQAIKPTKAIADIVVNHRAGSTSWGDFTNPTWGVVKGSNYAVICSDDEGFTGEPSLMGASSKRGAADTGDGYSAYRDLDHTNPTVQQGIVDWMNDVLKPAGFVGWRYDYVKGFAGKYVGQYNAGSNAEFSVGEYFPSAGYDFQDPNAWGNEIKNWISATATGGQKSKAFDFALKGAMNTVFGNKGDNITNSNYNLLAHSSNLIMSQPEDAVTFVDNHDTGSTQSVWNLDYADIGTAYAFILTHPGYPCVAWQHYFTYVESGSIVDPQQYIGGNTVPGTSNTYREHIDYLIDLRNRVGIEYDDTVVTTGTTSSCYVGEIVGNNGTLLVKIGNVTAATGTGYAGNNPIYSGTNFAIWEKNVDGDASLPSGGNSGGSGSGDSSRELIFTRPNDWGIDMFAHFWNDNGDITSWPGNQMTRIVQNEYGQHQFTIAVPEDATFVIFTDNSGKQTVDISLSENVTGYYITGKFSPYEVGSW